MALITLLRVGAKEKVAIFAPTNAAVTNIVSRLHEKDDYNRLLIHVWSSSLEEDAVLRYDPEGPDVWKNY
jgi:hypothetical protein